MPIPKGVASTGRLTLKRDRTFVSLAEAPHPPQETVRPTPASDHSSVCSGGAANIMKKRAVSAPYCSISDCGSTPLFFDLDMVGPFVLTVGRRPLAVAPVICPLASRRRSIGLSQ